MHLPRAIACWNHHSLSNQKACVSSMSTCFDTHCQASKPSSVLMFILLSIILTRLRRSNRLRFKMARYLPTSWKDEGNHKAWYKPKKSKKRSESGNNLLPYPQVHLYHSYYHQLAEKKGYFATALYPMPRSSNNISETWQQEQVVVIRQLEDNNQVITIEQHQQRLNWEIANLEAGRGVPN